MKMALEEHENDMHWERCHDCGVDMTLKLYSGYFDGDILCPDCVLERMSYKIIKLREDDQLTKEQLKGFIDDLNELYNDDWSEE